MYWEWRNRPYFRKHIACSEVAYDRENQHRMELGFVNPGVPGPLYYPAFSSKKKKLLPSELSVQRSDSFCDMQTKCFSLLEQSFVLFFEVRDRTHLALSQSFKYKLLLLLLSFHRKPQ